MFISSALAQTTPQPALAAGDAGLGNTIMLIVIAAAFFFFVMWPQMKRAKEHKKMLQALQKGDEVVVSGGILGKITKITDNYISLEITNNTEMTLQKAAVQMLLPKGTLKSVKNEKTEKPEKNEKNNDRPPQR